VKRFLLITAALVLSQAALAASPEEAKRPAKPAPAAPAALKDCSAYGAGFIALPQSGSCVRMGGRVQMQAQANSNANRAAPTTATGASGRVYLDSRSETEAGPLRVYVRTGVGRGSGPIDNKR
jgi:hypothetical protein